jgi:hypothetical protein
MVAKHACNIQLLQHQHIAFLENSVNELVLPVLTLTSNMQVKPSQLPNQYSSPLRTFTLPCQSSLQILNPLLGGE